MNVTLEQNIVVRLHQLDDSRLRDVEQALLDVKAEHQATASHLMGQL